MYQYEGKKILVEWIRGKNRKRIGVVVAIGFGDVGWSLCNVDKKDAFLPKTAINKAIGRAVQYKNFSDEEVARDIGYKARGMFIHMLGRSERYWSKDYPANLNEARSLLSEYIKTIKKYKPSKPTVKVGDVAYMGSRPVGIVTSFSSS